MSRGPETRLKARVMRWLNSQPDVFVFKVHGSPFQRAGLPDIVGNVGSAALWVELKSESGGLSPIQSHVHSLIRRSGASVCVARTVDEVQAHVERLRVKGT